MIKNLSMSVVAILLLQGCGGKTLQSVTDGYFGKSEKESQFTSEKVAISENKKTDKELQSKIEQWLNSGTSAQSYTTKDETISDEKKSSTYDARVNTTTMMSGSEVKEEEAGYLQRQYNSYDARVNTTAMMSGSEIKEEKGWMQSNLDEWFEKKWIPFLNDDDNKAIFTSDPDKPFTLQDFVDKWALYLKQKKEKEAGLPPKPSLSENMTKMPVIGNGE